MAQKIKVYLIDDIDGSDATDTINFAIDGVNYEIDLNEKHAAELRSAMEKWVSHARRLPARRTRRTGTARAAGTSDAAKIREWARENGYEVSERGRVPAEIREAYEQRVR